MHGYCSICAFMHNFTLIDMGVFFVKMCKISYFLYFVRADVVALMGQNDPYFFINIL